jgi:preprotein translocase SecE subunit
MASATKKPDENDMAEDAASGGADEARDEREDREERRSGGGGGGQQKPLEFRAPGAPMGGGFFHVYKRGQGYWTRMGTAAGLGLIGLLSANFIYSELPPRIDYLQHHHNAALLIAAGFLVVFGLLSWYYMNKPTPADFLIATDLEMKKVNWTSRKELLGSTKVVILFMFLIAILLFVTDVIFGYLFYFLRVLENRPF